MEKMHAQYYRISQNYIQMLSLATRQKIIQFLLYFLPTQQIYTPLEKKITIAIYALHSLLALPIMIQIASKIFPYAADQNSEFIIFYAFAGLRVILTLLYIYPKSRTLVIYFGSQMIQLTSLFLIHKIEILPVLLLQLGSDLIYVICKAQRKGNFDSRLCYKNIIMVTLILRLELILVNLFRKDAQDNNLSFLISLLILNTLSIVFSRQDPIYNARVKQLITCGKTIITYVLTYIIALQWYYGDKFKPSYLDYQFSLLPALTYFIFKWKFSLPYINYDLLSKNIDNLSHSHKKNYFIAAINFIEEKQIPHYHKIDLVKNHKKDCPEKFCHLCLTNDPMSPDLKKNFSIFIKKKLIKLVKTDTFFVYLLLFYFPQSMGSIFKKNLSSTNFFDKRQIKLIESQVYDNDLEQKMNRINEMNRKITKKSLEYLQKMKVLLSFLMKEKINLNNSEQKGTQMLQNYEFLTQIAPDFQEQPNRKRSEGRNNEKKGTYLSSYSLNILNIMRKQVFNIDETISDLAVDSDSSLFSQQDAIFCISAQEDNLGTFQVVNKGAIKLTCYSQSELLGKHLSMLLHPSLHEGHHKIINNRVVFRDENQSNQINANIFIINKHGTAVVCEYKSRFVNGVSGKIWIIKLKDISRQISFLITKEDGEIVAATYKANQILQNLNMNGQIFPKNFQQILTNQPMCSYCPLPDSPKIPFQFSIPTKFQVPQIPSLIPCYNIIKVERKSLICNVSTPINLDKMYVNEKKVRDKSFQFYFDVKNSKFTNRMGDKMQINEIEQQRGEQECKSRKRWELNDEISSLIYQNGELQFRQNKQLQEYHDCQSHPFARRLQEKMKEKISISSKEEVEMIIQRQEERKNPILIALYTVAIVVGIIFIVFTILSSLTLYETAIIYHNKYSLQSLLAINNVRFMQLATKISRPVWQSQNLFETALFADDIGNQSNTFQQMYRRIDDLKKQINKKWNVEQRWKNERFNDKIHHFQSSDQYIQIFEHLQLDIQTLDNIETPEQQQQLKFLYFVQIVRIVVPINIYVMNEVSSQIAKEIGTKMKQVNVFIIIGAVICFGTGIILLKLILMFRRQVLINFQNISHFQNEDVQNLYNKICWVQSKITNLYSSIGDQEAQNQTKQVQNNELVKKKKSWFYQTHKIIKIIIAILFFSSLFIIFSVSINLTVTKVQSLSNMEAFIQYYEKTLMSLNIMWLNKVLENSDPSYINMTRSQLGLSDTYWNIDEQQMNKKYNEGLFKSNLLMRSGFFAEEFKNQIAQSMDDWVIHQSHNKSSHSIFEYTVQSPSDLMQATRLVVTQIYEQIAQLERSGTNNKQESINKDLLNVFTIFQPRMMEQGQQMIGKQMGILKQQIVNLMIISISSVCIGWILFFLGIYWVGTDTKQRHMKILKIIGLMFPVKMLNRNVFFCHLYQKIWDHNEMKQ